MIHPLFYKTVHATSVGLQGCNVGLIVLLYTIPNLHKAMQPPLQTKWKSPLNPTEALVEAAMAIKEQINEVCQPLKEST